MVKRVEKEKKISKTKITADPTLVSKVLYAVDLYLLLWIVVFKRE